MGRKLSKTNLIDKRDRKPKMTRTRPIPAALAPLLDLLTPLTSGFKTTEAIVADLKKVGSISQIEQEFTRVFKSRVRELPKNVQRYIGVLHDDDSRCLSQTALRRYNDLVYSLEFLRQIAAISATVIGEIQARAEALNEKNARAALASFDRERCAYVPRIAFYQLPIDDAGKFDFSRNTLLAALQGEESLRIRFCQVCGRIFWAGRLDKTACSVKCGQISRKRKQRPLTGERRQQYNEARKKKRKRASTRQS